MAIQSITVPQTWAVSELVGALTESGDQQVRLELPRFQRAQVWSEPDQRALIRSIHEGHPIGSLLLYEIPGEAKPKRYLLVDGLQRTTAIRDYHSSPLRYLEAETVPQENVSALREALLEIGDGLIEVEDVDRALEGWMRATGELLGAKGFNANKLVSAVLEGLSIEIDDAGRESLIDLAHPVLDDIRDHVDIGAYRLPVIVYQGAEGQLPDIFEKINARGTKLNKYEVFAATWVNQETEVETLAIRDAILEKYASILEQGFKIPGLENGEIQEYSLFEYLFGLGKHLAAQFPLLFGRSDDPTGIESVAFTLATVAHGMRLSEMKSLPSKMLRDSAGRVEPQLFEGALIDAASFVNSVLRPFIELKLNSTNGLTDVAHTEYQISSMIARVLVGRYNPATWEEREAWEQERKAILATTLPQHYFYDVLQQNWRGSGDSRLYNHVWEEADDSGRRPSPLYLRVIAREEWNRAFDDWFEKQRLYSQKARSNVRGVDKLFLRFVYCNIVTAMEERQHVFEIDHLFPVSRLVQLIGDDAEGWPISSVGNLALFDWKTNREKTKYTIREYIDSLPENEKGTKINLLQRYLLCEIEDVDIPSTVGWGRDAYVEFLQKRFSTMRDRVLGVLKVPDAATLNEESAPYGSPFD